MTCCSRPWPTTPTSGGSCCMCNGGCAHRHSSPTARWSRGIVAPHRGRRSRRCWRTCICTTHSTRGCDGCSRRCRSSVTPTTWSCTPPAWRKPSGCVTRSRHGWPSAGCDCTRTRRGSCIARGTGGPARMSMSRSTFSATRSGRVRRAARPAQCSSGSCRRSPPARPRPSGNRSEAGGCTCGPTRACRTSPRSSTPSCAAGSTTTGASTARC